MDEYKQINEEMNQIIQKRMQITSQNYQWDYQKQLGKSLHAQPFKYQTVSMPHEVQLTQDVKSIIYNQNQSPEDKRMFSLEHAEWTLAPIQQSAFSVPTVIPSASFMRTKKTETSQIQAFFGKLQMQGKIKGKASDLHYVNYHFNLRTNALTIYKSDKPEAGDKQILFFVLNQKTFDYLSDATDYLFLRGEEQNFKILKEDSSKALIEALERKLLIASMRGTYAFRNQVPDWRIIDYISGEIDEIGPLMMNDEQAIKNIAHTKPYKESVGSYMKLLQRFSRKRNNKAAEIHFPGWLKEQFKEVPKVQTWLSTNIVPPQHSLMSLKIKVNPVQKKSLLLNLKYIFPYLKNFVKRSIVIYQSQLNDEQAKRVLQNISYPMYIIGFPKNQLSIQTVYHAIQKTSDFFNEILDFNYNSKLLTISGSKILNLINNNPTLKKLYLKGCQVANGEQDIFFDALSSNLCINQMELDYHETYNETMVHFLDDFEASIQ